MGEDTVDAFYKIKGTKATESKSAHIKIHGFTSELPKGHLSIYGKDAANILALNNKGQAFSNKLHPSYPYMEAEVIWAVREEMAIKIEDVLSRRIRLLILDANSAIQIAPKVAELMAEEMGKDHEWIKKELKDFYKLANKYIIN
jgi:glycerol-3-phosphate dehydrogenase